MYQTKALNVQYKTIAGTVIGVVLANVAVAVRLTSKRIGKIELRADDYLMFVALVRKIASSTQYDLLTCFSGFSLGYCHRGGCQ